MQLYIATCMLHGCEHAYYVRITEIPENMITYLH